MTRRTIAACVAGLMVLCAATARADEESAKLTQYREKVDSSVMRALDFLARNRMKNRKTDSSFDGAYGKTNAVAGLVGMAFLSKGYSPRSGPHSDAIRGCVDYVLSTPAEKGYLGVRGGRMYGHGIATLFLSEVSGMVSPSRQKKIDKMMPKALRVILDAQKTAKKEGPHRHGWRYEPTTPTSDISVTGWQIMALRSARLNGAPVPGAAIKNAMSFIDRCRNPQDDGGFFYSPGRFTRAHPFRGGKWLGGPSTAARTGAALLCRELGGHHGDRVNKKTGDFILKNVKQHGFLKDTWHEYATYYCSQGMFQLGGKYWEEFAPPMYEYLFRKQKPNGSWKTGYGDVYPTAMYVLALTVSYRQLPIYQR